MGAEWHFTPDLIFTAEYCPIDWSNTFGYRDNQGNTVKQDDTIFDLNFGIKYKLTDYFHATAALIGGNSFGGSINLEIPLNPEGLLAWKKHEPYRPGEKLKWQAEESNNEQLSALIAEEIKKLGFIDISAACSDDAIWIEFQNTVHLSHARAVGRVGAVLDKVIPQRIKHLYFNVKTKGTVITSLRFGRKEFQAFLESKIDDQGLAAFSKFTLYKTENWETFEEEAGASAMVNAQEPRFSFKIEPKIRTFLNNKAGFFKHKGLLRAQGSYRIGNDAAILGELEYTLFNQYEELIYDPLERENAVRTDLVEYETGQEIRLSQLAFNQFLDLPNDVQGRFSAGFFETQYAGLGVECFRYFKNGLWGIGFESQLVKKRDPESTFKIHDEYDNLYKTGFLNIYAQPLPSLGIESGIKFGRFLAGDVGVLIDLRRTFKYFTIGAWYTKTDTSLFESEANKDADQKGVYITFPLSAFAAKDITKRLRYTISSFTRDQGATVRQPGRLYPLSTFSTPDHFKRNINNTKSY